MDIGLSPKFSDRFLECTNFYDLCQTISYLVESLFSRNLGHPRHRNHMVQYAEVYLDQYEEPSFKYQAAGGPGAVLIRINTTLDSYLTGGCKLGTRP